MTKILKIVSLVGVGLVLSLLVVLFVLDDLIRVGELRQFLIHEVESLSQMKVRAGEADLHVGGMIGVSIQDFSLHEKNRAVPVFAAERVLIRVALLPLLQRKIVFDEIRFYRPAIQIGRGPKGKTPLLDLIVSLPFQKAEGVQFALDVNRVRIENAEVVFRNRGKGRGRSVTYFHEMDLSFRRLRPEEVPLLGVRHDIPALEYSLNTTVERGGQLAGLASKGKIVFPYGGFELQQAWLDAGVGGESLPASLFRDYYRALLPVKSLNGTLNLRLHWQGSLAEQAHIEGEVDFQQLRVDAPDIFPGVVVPGDGHLEAEITLSPQEIAFPRLDFRSDEISLSARGSVRFLAERDPHLDLHLTTPFLPLLTVRKYLPLKALGTPQWEVLVRAVNQGEARLIKSGVSGRLSEIRRLSKPGFEHQLWFDAEVRGVGGKLLGNRYLPVHGVSGRIVLERGVLHYKGLKGTYGQSLLEEIEGRQKVLTGRDLLELRVRGEADLGQLWGQIKLDGLPPRAAKVASGLCELGGKGGFRLFLRTDFASSHHYEGQIVLRDALFRTSDLFLSQVKGGLSFSPREIGVKRVTALFGGSALHGLSGRLRVHESGIDIQGFRGQLGGYGFNLSGRWRYQGEPRLTFTFRAPEMDLAQLLGNGEAPSKDCERVRARGRISIDRGRYEGFELSQLTADLTLDERRLVLDNLTARSGGGTIQAVGHLVQDPEDLSFSFKPKVQGVPVKGFLEWFNIRKREIRGKVNLSGTFESSGKTVAERKRNVNGAFRVQIEDGLLKRFAALVQVLSLMDLSKWFTLTMPDVDREGLRFRRISADFKVVRGVYSTENLILDGDDLLMTGAGQLDVPKGNINFVIAVRPFPGIGSAVSSIPLIGRGLAGIKNSLLVASFRIKGPIERPTISPAPLSTLSEFLYGGLALPKELIRPSNR